MTINIYLSPYYDLQEQLPPIETEHSQTVKELQIRELFLLWGR